MGEFNMETETLSSFQVFHFVPVVNRSFLYLSAGNDEDILAALGRQLGRLELFAHCSCDAHTMLIYAHAPLSSMFVNDIAS